MYHPDRNPNANQDKFKQMTAAYTVLSNDITKRRYDDTIRGGPFTTSNNESSNKSYHYNSTGSSKYWTNYG